MGDVSLRWLMSRMKEEGFWKDFTPGICSALQHSREESGRTKITPSLPSRKGSFETTRFVRFVNHV